jgi:hypothetical protein
MMLSKAKRDWANRLSRPVPVAFKSLSPRRDLLLNGSRVGWDFAGPTSFWTHVLLSRLGTDPTTDC